MKHEGRARAKERIIDLSVLSVEPYGMKLRGLARLRELEQPFSALGRAVWDETRDTARP